jgi:hypothetical protein
MKSPFPGMNPYLEGSLWPDLHHRLATKISNILVPLITPKYMALIERYVVEDTEPSSDLGIMYPDVEVFAAKRPAKLEEPAILYGGKRPPVPATLSIPILRPVEVRIPVIEIKDREGNRLVTAIEILSPVNKRKPGLEPYLEKRRRLHEANVHLLEIDLIRRGTRTISHPELGKTDYLVALTRAQRYQTDVWEIDLKAPLPVVPVPLLAPDEDVYLDLQQALDEVFSEAAYHYMIDYSKPAPPPLFTKAEEDWVKSLIPAPQ